LVVSFGRLEVGFEEQGLWKVVGGLIDYGLNLAFMAEGHWSTPIDGQMR